MRHLLHPAMLVAILGLTYSGSIPADETTERTTEPPGDLARFNQDCVNLMQQVLHQGSIRFAMSSAKLGNDAHGVLDEIVEIAMDCPALSITITGHTDNTGDESFNKSLSRARAEAVVTYLTERGIEPERLTARGAGSDTPIASNDDLAGRRVNRRIEFELQSLPL
jgi:OOP family OmpA-OmpF porin